MQEFKNKIRLNSAAKGSLLASYSDDDIAAMARYLAGL
jgi:cytochrome c553